MALKRPVLAGGENTSMSRETGQTKTCLCKRFNRAALQQVKQIWIPSLLETPDGCPTCQSLYDGLESLVRSMPHYYESWDRIMNSYWNVHIDNGIYLSPRRTPMDKETGRFEVYTSDEDGINVGSSLNFREHIIPFLEDGMFQAKMHSLFDSEPLPSPPFPARILDLGSPSENGALSDLRLLNIPDGVNFLQRYVALSYCWLRQLPAIIPQLSRPNLHQHLQRISFESLPEAFRQAVLVCRQLDIRYLWIDSLCILQDDPDDWERESTKMSSIYEKACVTLAMHDSVNGVLPRRDLTLSPTSPGETARLHIRPILAYPEVYSLTCEAPRGRFHDTIVDNKEWNVLAMRGWCYQERVLSRRVLHFTGQEALLEANGQIILCQCSQHVTKSHKVGFAGWLPTLYTTDYTASEAWGLVVSQYSARMFSRQTDLLPGIAGIAQRFSHGLNRGRYIAGLWEKDLLRWLCWKSMPWGVDDRNSRLCPFCRPRPRRVQLLSGDQLSEVERACQPPSFSWASRFGPCNFMHHPWGGEFKPVAHIVSAHCNTGRTGPFAIVHGGFVDIRGDIHCGLHFSTVGKDRKSVDNCRTEKAYITDPGFLDRWDLTSMSSLESILLVRNHAGQEYIIDAMDDILEDGAAVSLLELWRDDYHGESIMMVLSPLKADIEDHRNTKGESCSVQCFRRIGIGVFKLSCFLEPMPVRHRQQVRIV